MTLKPPPSVELGQQPPLLCPFSVPTWSSYGVVEPGAGVDSLQWADMFQTDLKSFANEDGSYLFSVTLTPQFDLADDRIKQNYYFIIDYSHSTEKHKYQTFQKAAMRAIHVLHEEDHFNIIIFGANTTQLGELPLPSNIKNRQAAELFLTQHVSSRRKSGAEIYAALPSLIPSHLHPNEAHTIILLSDGNSHLKPGQQHSKITTWLATAQGKVSLYTAAVGPGNNLAMLDWLGTASRGSLLYSETHTAFPRKLANLVLTLRSPIAQEMSCTLLHADPAAHITLLPTSSRLPRLLNHRPYVLLGRAEKLSNFSLLLQGKNKDQLVSITKNILLEQAEVGYRPLVKQWPIYRAHLLYEQYLQEKDLSLLEEASQLLAHEPIHSRR